MIFASCLFASQTTGNIRGIVTELQYSKGLWNYRVVSEDTTNLKLSSADFTHTKRVAKKGDFVYTIIKNGKLKELFLINRSNLKQKKPKKRAKTVNKHNKRTKNHQILETPTTESVKF